MGTCKFCGKSVGLFSRVHKECEEKHANGIQGMNRLMQRYFCDTISASEFSQKLSHNRAPYFLSDNDIAESAISALTNFGNTLKRPYSNNTLLKIKDFIKNIGIPYSLLNISGAMDSLGQKLLQGYVVDFFAKGVPISQINNSTNSVTSVLPLSPQKKIEAYLNVLNKAADKFMADGNLSDHEQNQIILYTSSFGIDINCIPLEFQNEALMRIGQAIILKDLQKGIFPQQLLTVPIILGKGEVPLWTYQNVTMFQEKITREYKGGNHGLSFRLIKGVTYRTGSFKGKPIEKSSMEIIGVGELVVTNKHLFFHCPTYSVKIPYSKLIGITPYSDGIEVHKEEAKPKRIAFQGFDAWFIVNAMNTLNN